MFDYYVLSLSWSPSWCQLTGLKRGAEQCDATRDLAWILHGLWPQYENGWPKFCKTTQPAPTPKQLKTMRHIMGSEGLALHACRKHGTCANLAADDYFQASRAAFEAIRKPDQLTLPLSEQRFAPTSLIDSVLRDNLQLQPNNLVVTCRKGLLHELRICLDKQLSPRCCGRDVLRGCSDPYISAPTPP
ncbi:ribonuclease T2 [Paracoccaceae bacterium]|nr:ribonuclease T2 [Paracoccaceae bacterium]